MGDPSQLVNNMTQLVTALTAMFAAIGSVIGILISLRNGKKLDSNSEKIVETKKSLEVNNAMTKDIHVATNGKLDTLVKTVQEVAANAKVDSAAARAAVAESQIKTAVINADTAVVHTHEVKEQI